MKGLLDGSVAIERISTKYPANQPYLPTSKYPEITYRIDESNSANQVYDGIRNLLHLLSLDEKNFDTCDWNPLGDLIKDGNKVIVKPNLVLDSVDEIAALTHPSIIRAIVDYVLIALNGTGQVLIADSPQENAQLTKMRYWDILQKIVHNYNSHGHNVELVDLRRFLADDRYNSRKKKTNIQSIDVSLDQTSSFEEYLASDMKRFYGAWFDQKETRNFHSPGKHTYSVSQEILDADVFITIPKMKTHSKVGVTLSLKSIVGILTNKNCLPHYRRGFPPKGDQYSEPQRIKDYLSVLHESILYRLGSSKLSPMRRYISSIISRAPQKNGIASGETKKKSFFASYGDWYGNDTVWRGVIDLNRIIRFADKGGEMQSEPQRRYLSIIDGVIGGEGEGPLHPSQKAAGVLFAGYNPAFVDLVGATLMGFDFSKISLVKEALKEFTFKMDDLKIRTDIREWKSLSEIAKSSLQFKPPVGWPLDCIEISPSQELNMNLEGKGHW